VPGATERPRAVRLHGVPDFDHFPHHFNSRCQSSSKQVQTDIPIRNNTHILYQNSTPVHHDASASRQKARPPWWANPDTTRRERFCQPTTPDLHAPACLSGNERKGTVNTGLDAAWTLQQSTPHQQQQLKGIIENMDICRCKRTHTSALQSAPGASSFLRKRVLFSHHTTSCRHARLEFSGKQVAVLQQRIKRDKGHSLHRYSNLRILSIHAIRDSRQSRTLQARCFAI
jgi:hypothetical protein